MLKGFITTLSKRRVPLIRAQTRKDTGCSQYQTVFIIGAGAGDDIKMPVGSELSRRIASKLDFRFGADIRHGDQTILAALGRIAKEQGERINHWIAAGQTVAKVIGYTRSIDAYINTHKDNQKLKDCAKLAIAQTILQAEESCAISLVADRKWKDAESVDKSWLPSLSYLLQDKIVLNNNLGELLKTLCIINFNYDRCIEHFLFWAVQDLYHKSESEAAEILVGLNIFHPYGSVGVLPWQNGELRNGWTERVARECIMEKVKVSLLSG